MRSIGALMIFAAVAATACRGTEQTAKVEYPPPRYPRYLVHPSMDKLLAAARLAVRQPYGRSPLGKVQSGQEVYVIFQYGQDQAVWEAIKTAWAERGVTAKSVGNWDVLGMTKEEHDARVQKAALYGSDGWQELGVFEPAYKPFFPEDVQNQFKPALTSTLIRANLRAFLDKRPDITLFFAGNGGGNFWQRAAGPDHENKFMGNWIFDTAMDLLVKTNEFPGDLWSLVDDKVVKPIPHVVEGTFTDPEGTRLHWTLTNEQRQHWAKRTGGSGHLNLYPELATYEEGIIRASANHVGYFPTMTVRLSKHGRVDGVEGGARTGELFRMLIEHPRMKAVRFPRAPEPGYWYLSQDGFGTNPKFVRDLARLEKGSSSFGNLSERNRAGVQHFSFASLGDASDPKDLEYAKAQGVPLAPAALNHTMHMHVYFPTVKWRLADTGEWITVAEQGNVRAFDDPEVRALAARYQDPALMFRYEWIPSVPGVNVNGDLSRDYASDPWKWVMKEWSEIQAGAYAYYVDDYAPAKPATGEPAARPPAEGMQD